MKTIRVILKPEKDKPIRAFHPWIFSGAIDRLDDDFKTGDLVKVYSQDEAFLGIGYLNPRSQIAVRILTFQEEEIDLSFFVKRFEASKKLREEFMPPRTNAYRLVHSEGDFLPGLIVDRYGDFLITQFSTAGMDALKPIVLEAIKKVFDPKGVFERDDAEARRLEGLNYALQVLSGEEPPDYIEIEECGIKFVVDIKHGQKTGFFLDQRENRRKVGDQANGKRVLNCFAYSGGFSVYAAKAGAQSVKSVEIQERALNTMQTNFELNGFKGDQYQFICEDVFDFLRADTGTYDLIVLDPPAFCKSKHQINEAARGYKDINLYAIRHLAPDGILFTSSCSSYIDPGLFQKIVFGAAKDASRNVQIIKKTSHPFDHPINIYHPEGEYLKGLFLRVQ
ncbi:MAG: class I SAM-dependent rRNA methyltransferase [Candidatus Omnitrophica bacterium]|nr:class I SAM-dependent rRNA methyltransferase [Candidatus Omnitrophota bacterium]